VGGAMLTDTVPRNEVDRLHALSAYRILDTPQEGEFDHCARLIAQVCGTEIGAVTLIDHNRQWMKAVYGPLQKTIPRNHAFCAQTILQDSVLEVPDALLDQRFVNNPCVTSAPSVRFYAGVALQARNGLALGTICVMDPRPQRLKDQQLKALAIAGSYISAQLEIRLGVLQLLEERALAKNQTEAITRASQRQKELSALLVHDLRSPLASVRVNGTFLVEDATLSKDQQAALRDIVEAGEQLTGMVNDLLQVGRAEDGQLMVRRKAPVDLIEIIRAAIAHSRAVAAAGRIRVELESCPEGVVEGDKDLLFRVVTNLLDNACKYAPSNSCIRVEVSSVDSSVVLRVVDQGSGIPPEQRLLIFDKYFQVDQAAPSRPGYGLGLSFCKLAVEAHHGWIEVEEVPKGCCFRVSLPRIGTAKIEPSSAVRTSPSATRPSEIEQQADLLVERARHVAERVLTAARSKEDVMLQGSSPGVLDAVEQERVEADRVLDVERTDAARKLQDERDKGPR
jgi:signal transduction histidine kinase